MNENFSTLQGGPPIQAANSPYGTSIPPDMRNPYQNRAGSPQIRWAMSPGRITGCPEGLEILATLDQLIINQEVDLLEVVAGIEVNNR